MPYPPDYGGAFEMFYKIRALHHEGIRIHLHCFEYGRGKQSALDQFCRSVRYYRRDEGHKGFSLQLPYIVSSRADNQLLEELAKDNFPILFEGLHTTFLLHENKLAGRKILVRLHNIEHLYYRELSRQTRSLYRKLYYWHESRLLKRYEKKLAGAAHYIAITEQEATYYRDKIGATRVSYLPAFIGWDFPLSKEGVGTFCLYHGNLGVAENEKAARWLLEQVFNDLEIPFVVAGKNPSPGLEKLAHSRQHTCLVANPSEIEMQDLIQKAQINILPSFSVSGIKFKLLNAVFCGRHVVINDDMAEESNLGPACHIASEANALKSIVSQLYRKPFCEEEIHLRENLLQHFYNNRQHVRQLISWLY